MQSSKFIAYYRVSTDRQGRSGLGLEAQQAAVRAYLNGGDWTLVREFVEVESGKRDDRPKLVEALRLCELTGSTLIVAKLDRLSRDAEFLFRLDKSPVNIRFADMPMADKVMIGIMAVVAQWEREQISKRTKEALGAAKARGTKLGGDRGNLAGVAALGASKSLEMRKAIAADRGRKVMHYIDEARASGASTFAAMAEHLNHAGIQTPRGKTWHPASVQKLLVRMEGQGERVA
jgi:DNA invertase Pin-like site-specific DNA recombinase